jgi:hypothetical protein
MLGGKREHNMSERIIAFVENWVTENVHAEGYPAEGDLTQAKTFAAQCRAEALTSGIPAAEIDDEFDDIEAFMSVQIHDANDREVHRQVDKDQS